jgi:hypothetical protein
LHIRTGPQWRSSGGPTRSCGRCFKSQCRRFPADATRGRRRVQHAVCPGAPGGSPSCPGDHVNPRGHPGVEGTTDTIKARPSSAPSNLRGLKGNPHPLVQVAPWRARVRLFAAGPGATAISPPASGRPLLSRMRSRGIRRNTSHAPTANRGSVMLMANDETMNRTTPSAGLTAVCSTLPSQSFTQPRF